MHIDIEETDCHFSKRELRRLWEALEPEGKLGWNPAVALPSSDLRSDGGEPVPSSKEVPSDRGSFEDAFQWLVDSEEENTTGEQEDVEGDAGRVSQDGEAPG